MRSIIFNQYQELSPKQLKFKKYLDLYEWDYDHQNKAVCFFHPTYVFPYLMIYEDGSIYATLFGKIKTMNDFLNYIRKCNKNGENINE